MLVCVCYSRVGCRALGHAVDEWLPCWRMQQMDLQQMSTACLRVRGRASQVRDLDGTIVEFVGPPQATSTAGEAPRLPFFVHVNVNVPDYDTVRSSDFGAVGSYVALVE